MTKKEWKKIADWWGTGTGYVKMTVGEHRVSLFNTIDKKKMIVQIQIYVDDYIRGEYHDVKSEIGNRFWQRVKHPLYSAKRLKEMIKAFGKRSKMAQQTYYEYNIPTWRSFNAFKKHITSHNTDIKLISCGWEETEANDEPKDQ